MSLVEHMYSSMTFLSVFVLKGGQALVNAL